MKMIRLYTFFTAFIFMNANVFAGDLEDGVRLKNQGDYQAAVISFRKAADSGSVIAMRMLGEMLSSGQGIEKNGAKAVELFSKAADLGDAQAQLYLGMEYRMSQNKDIKKSNFWLHKAALNGSEGAKGYLMILANLGELTDEKDVKLFCVIPGPSKTSEPIEMVVIVNSEYKTANGYDAKFSDSEISWTWSPKTTDSSERLSYTHTLNRYSGKMDLVNNIRGKVGSGQCNKVGEQKF